MRSAAPTLLEFGTVVGDGFVLQSPLPLPFPFPCHHKNRCVLYALLPRLTYRHHFRSTRRRVLYALLLQVEDDDHRIRHLALLSQYAVFKDILPSYRIRIPTAAEMATKVSKDVHRVRAQEAALLRAYQVRKTRASPTAVRRLFLAKTFRADGSSSTNSQ